jgi:dihydrofolate synthase/folylpolyglutamate synthase
LTYREALARLYAARRGGVVLGLERIEKVLARLGDPQRRLGAVIHVAGTNGKGSTVAMLAAMASAGGLRVATYTSPHLCSLTERVVVAGVPISEEQLVAAAIEVWSAGGDQLTFFEQITAMGLLHIAASQPELTLLEVGLGGRLDATNVVQAEVGLVTGVALDHQDILGATLDAIAHEKAGIFKTGQHAVIGAAGDPAAVPALVQVAHARDVAAVVVVDAAAVATAPESALLGEHQHANAAAALVALDALGRATGHLVHEGARREGLRAVRHPGRMEVVAAAPTVILDGAHNPQGAAALARATIAGARPRVLVLGISADKAVDAMILALAPACDAIIATAFSQPRALAAGALAARIRDLLPGMECVEVPGAMAAVTLARERAGAAGTVVVAGSLLLVGEVRGSLVGGKIDPIWVTDPSPGRPQS